MLNIALFGPPGAGKGTQSKYLVDKYNLLYISTGDILRKELAEESQLGLAAKDIISRGGLVSDEIIVQIIEKTIKESTDADGFLFDGFPRTFIQAYILEGLMIKLNTQLDCLISIEVPEEESVQRLLERGINSGRADDNEEVIRYRMQEYLEKTKPVLQFFKDKGIFIPVDGLQSIENVTQQIDSIVSKELSKRLMNVVLFGYPGSGRGSVGLQLAKKYNLEFVSTGKMLGQEIEEGTELGKKIKAAYEGGQLVPDEIVVKLIEKKISNASSANGFIFKGYPRTLVQSYILDGMLRKYGTTISQIIEIEVGALELIRRLDERSKTDACMPYDTSTAKIVHRLQEHENKTLSVLKKYKEIHSVKVVDGSKSKPEVFENVSKIIEDGFRKLR